MKKNTSLNEGFIWDNLYQIVKPLKVSAMSHLYLIKINFNKFSIPKLISYWEANVQNIPAPRIENYCKNIILKWEGEPKETLVKYCKEKGISLPKRDICVLKIKMDKDQEKGRFKSEWQKWVGCKHPNVIEIYAGGEFKNYPYYIMEYISDFYKLEDLYKLPLEEKIQFVIQASNVLYFLHRRGLIHRDIKLDNFLVFKHKEKLRVKILDFGITKDISVDRTVKGQVLGTPNFMSPEQIKESSEIDFRSDIYSLGATFYELISGKTPYEGQDLLSVINYISLGVPPESLKKIIPDIPTEIQSLIQKMMAYKTDKRPKSMLQVKEYLEDFLDPNKEVKVFSKEVLGETKKLKKRKISGSRVTGRIQKKDLSKKKTKGSYKKASEKKKNTSLIIKLLFLFIIPALLLLYILIFHYWLGSEDKKVPSYDSLPSAPPKNDYLEPEKKIYKKEAKKEVKKEEKPFKKKKNPFFIDKSWKRKNIAKKKYPYPVNKWISPKKIVQQTRINNKLVAKKCWTNISPGEWMGKCDKGVNLFIIRDYPKAKNYIFEMELKVKNEEVGIWMRGFSPTAQFRNFLTLIKVPNYKNRWLKIIAKADDKKASISVEGRKLVKNDNPGINKNPLGIMGLAITPIGDIPAVVYLRKLRIMYLP